jgi:hypothetical protein
MAERTQKGFLSIKMVSAKKKEKKNALRLENNDKDYARDCLNFAPEKLEKFSLTGATISST